MQVGPIAEAEAEETWLQQTDCGGESAEAAQQ